MKPFIFNMGSFWDFYPFTEFLIDTLHGMPTYIQQFLCILLDLIDFLN